MTLYQKLCRSSLDVEDLGLLLYQPGTDTIGTDPSGHIRFCTMDGFGETIFAQGERTFPLANNFSEFLGLLVACGHTDLLLNTNRWTRLRFQRVWKAYHPGRKQKMILTAIQNSFHPPVIDDPWGYIHALQTPSTVHPNTATDQDKTIYPQITTQYAEDQWQIRQIRLNEDGIDLELWIRIDGQRIVSFYDRWESVCVDEEQQLLRNAQDPFALHTVLSATVNGFQTNVTILEHQRWDPLSQELEDANALLGDSGLDPEYGWQRLILRLHRTVKKKKLLRSLALHLCGMQATLPGPGISTPTFQYDIPIVHPCTGQRHMLSIHSISEEALDPNFLIDPPCHYTRLCYSLEPPLSEDAFSLFDSVPNDRLRTPPGASEPYPDPELEDAPTWELADIDEALPAHIRTAFSSRHYTPPKSIHWRTRFCCKLRGDNVIQIIGKP